MTEPIRVVLSGATGRMGTTLAALIAADPALEVVGGFGQTAGSGGDFSFPVVESPEEAGPWLGGAAVVIDFSSPELLVGLLRAHASVFPGAALVVGTTGLGPEVEQLLQEAARTAPVLSAANFSLGINLLLALAENATRALGRDFDVEIVETHHRRKVDAPSGTALALGEVIARTRAASLGELRRDGRSGNTGERPPGEIGIHALRGGDVVGEHRVLFLGDGERIELAHLAEDRAIFAEGALRAARWCSGRAPGRYTMRDLLEL